MKSGALYAFWITPDATGASHGYVAAGGPGFPGRGGIRPGTERGAGKIGTDALQRAPKFSGEGGRKEEWERRPSGCDSDRVVLKILQGACVWSAARLAVACTSKRCRCAPRSWSLCTRLCVPPRRENRMPLSSSPLAIAASALGFAFLCAQMPAPSRAGDSWPGWRGPARGMARFPKRSRP